MAAFYNQLLMLRRVGNYRPSRYLQEWLRHYDVKYNITGDTDVISKPAFFTNFNVLLAITDHRGELKSCDLLLSNLDNHGECDHLYKLPDIPEASRKSLFQYVDRIRRIKGTEIHSYFGDDLSYFEIPYLPVRMNGPKFALEFIEESIREYDAKKRPNQGKVNEENAKAELKHKAFRHMIHLFPKRWEEMQAAVHEAVDKTFTELERDFIHARNSTAISPRNSLDPISRINHLSREGVQARLVFCHFTDIGCRAIGETETLGPTSILSDAILRMSSDKKEGVQLSTIHQAKGLEWSVGKRTRQPKNVKCPSLKALFYTRQCLFHNLTRRCSVKPHVRHKDPRLSKKAANGD